MAHLINQNGDVAALCSKTPRPINMKRATWTTDINAVTCAACKKKPQPEKWKGQNDEL